MPHLPKALFVVRHLMNRIITISLFLIFVLQSCKDKSPSLEVVVKEMADYKMFEEKIVGLTGDLSPQWARYETLLAKSSETELIQLCNNNSPVVRAYAFQGLIEKKSTNIFEILVKHIDDVGKFDRIMGCMVDPCYVSDFYLEQVGYFPDDPILYQITPKQRDYIDSTMLFGSGVKLRYDNNNQLKIRSRAWMLENLAPKAVYYNRLREIVIAGVIEALPALAKFKNPNDLSLIRKVYDTEGAFGEGFVFDAILCYPHPDLFDIVAKAVTNDLQNDDYFYGSNFNYYKALILFKNSKSKELLAQTLSKGENDNQLTRASSIRDLIENKSDHFFKGLLN